MIVLPPRWANLLRLLLLIPVMPCCGLRVLLPHLFTGHPCGIVLLQLQPLLLQHLLLLLLLSPPLHLLLSPLLPLPLAVVSCSFSLPSLLSDCLHIIVDRPLCFTAVV